MHIQNANQMLLIIYHQQRVNLFVLHDAQRFGGKQITLYGRAIDGHQIAQSCKPRGRAA